MQESGEPMEAGFLIFTRCFQGLLVKGRRMGWGGVKMEGGGIVNEPGLRFSLSGASRPCMMLYLLMVISFYTLKMGAQNII